MKNILRIALTIGLFAFASFKADDTKKNPIEEVLTVGNGISLVIEKIGSVRVIINDTDTGYSYVLYYTTFSDDGTTTALTSETDGSFTTLSNFSDNTDADAAEKDISSHATKGKITFTAVTHGTAITALKQSNVANGFKITGLSQGSYYSFAIVKSKNSIDSALSVKANITVGIAPVTLTTQKGTV